MPKPSDKKSSRLLSVFLGVFGLILLALLFLNRVAISDYVKGLSYTPSSEMSSIRDSLSLTSSGARIFNATFPALESRDDFNKSCESHNSEVSVLGCFTNDKIHVYNVDSSDLPGIRESTTAHELLHAVWSRLSGLEKNNLIPLLESAYSEHLDVLKETIESYGESERLDELYVRLATQIPDLPDALESHYDNYFKDRSAVVAFYNSYAEPFSKLKSEIENLSTELKNLESEISNRRSDYESRLGTFNAEASEFQTCANTLGCFVSEATFNARKRELTSVAAELDDARNELNSLITSYNEKVEIYNAHLLRSQDLQNLINSNSNLENIE